MFAVVVACNTPQRYMRCYSCIQYYSSKHGAVDGVRVWLPCVSPSAGAIRREYATTLGELLMHRHDLVGDLLINYF